MRDAALLLLTTFGKRKRIVVDGVEEEQQGKAGRDEEFVAVSAILCHCHPHVGRPSLALAGIL
jgi:hypothetical protein